MPNIRYKRPATEEVKDELPAGGRKVARELFGLFLLFWGLLVLLALLTYSQQDPGLNHVVSHPEPVRNAAGVFGAYLSGLLVDLFGFASFVWPAVFLAWGAGFVSSWFSMPWWRWFGFLLLGGCLISLGAALNFGLGDVRGGGMLGMTLYKTGTGLFSPAGSLLIWLFLLFLSLELAFGICWMALLHRGWAYGKTKAAEKDLTWARISRTLPELAARCGRGTKTEETEEVIPLLHIHVDEPLPGELPRLADPADDAPFDEIPVFETSAPPSAPASSDAARGAFPTEGVMPASAPQRPAEETPAETAEGATPPSTTAEEDKPSCTPGGPMPENRTVPAASQPYPAEPSAGPVAVPQPSGETTDVRVAPAVPPETGHKPVAGPPRASSDLPTAAPGEQTEGTSAGSRISFGAAVGAAADALGSALRKTVADFPPAGSCETPPDMPTNLPDNTVAAPRPDAVASVPQPAPAPVAPTVKARLPMPPFDLLSKPQQSDVPPPLELMQAKGEKLMACIADFGIQGDLVRVTPGPVVTMFEVRPAPGVKVARIANLNQDIALSLKAEAVRIQAPIPGHDTVGVEIPNESRSTVNFREILESDVFSNAEALLTMALGKDIGGLPVVADLAKMPHLLVAGATGAGKSVCLNALLLSLLYKATPDEVKLLLVDPKRIELAVYADLPHLVHPVVTDMTLAKTALDWAVHEMEERYTAMARLGVRNILGYNTKLKEMGDARPPELADLEPLPYLVIIVDELADLMLTAGKDVETAIVRLAQLARAGGIHLILATQRPSVDVVTGLIKANFPCRIAFQVSNKYDSRTILDSVGAELLLGRGDMLFKPNGGKLRRLHGAFVPDDDVAAVVGYWKRQRAPEYRVDFSEWGLPQAPAPDPATAGAGNEEEALYVQVVSFACEEGQKISISKLQRRFRIGFNKAARFMERMEQDGIITPPDRANRARQIRRDDL